MEEEYPESPDCLAPVAASKARRSSQAAARRLSRASTAGGGGLPFEDLLATIPTQTSSVALISLPLSGQQDSRRGLVNPLFLVTGRVKVRAATFSSHVRVLASPVPKSVPGCLLEAVWRAVTASSRRN